MRAVVVRGLGQVAVQTVDHANPMQQILERRGRATWRGEERPGRRSSLQGMKRMSSGGMTTTGRIMSRSSCSRMWQWYM